MKKVILFGVMALGAANVQAQNWLLLGNAGTNPSVNFIGTTDNKDVIFRRNNVKAGLLNAQFENSSFGVGALGNLNIAVGGGFSTYGNSGFGYNALLSNTGAGNTAIGARALLNNTSGYGNTSTGAYSLNNSTTASFNTANGISTLYSNTTGSYNTAIGGGALSSNTTGDENTATGSSALSQNTTGYENTAIGKEVLYNNTTGVNNTASGYRALYANSTGNYNIANGSFALGSNSTGSDNTANGAYALYANTVGNQNTATGEGALQSNVNGYYNTSVGAYSSNNITNGNFNTAIGYSAGPFSGSLSNTSALGYIASPTASNQIVLGNTSITSILGYGSVTITSDGRFKANIKENVPGLEFINQLKPVTYNYKIHELNTFLEVDKKNGKQSRESESINEAAITAKEKMVYTGFVAQEVEKAADKVGYNFSGVHKPQNEKDPYGLSYAEFVPPLVKAVQELSAKNEEKQTEIQQLNDKLKVLEQKLDALINNHSGSTELNNNTTLVLDQNAPNPFAESTTINYSINADFGTALISISNNTGVVIKTYPITTKGKSQLTVYGSNLSSGVYRYTLIVDGKTIETKSMIKN